MVIYKSKEKVTQSYKEEVCKSGMEKDHPKVMNNKKAGKYECIDMVHTSLFILP